MAPHDQYHLRIVYLYYCPLCQHQHSDFLFPLLNHLNILRIKLMTNYPLVGLQEDLIAKIILPSIPISTTLHNRKYLFTQSNAFFKSTKAVYVVRFSLSLLRLRNQEQKYDLESIYLWSGTWHCLFIRACRPPFSIISKHDVTLKLEPNFIISSGTRK